MNLNGKRVLITGGTAGIGLEAARQFIAIGAQVIITGRNQAKLDEAKKLLPTVTAIRSDTTNADDALALVEAVKQLGGIDILYNNAGVGVPPTNLGIANDNHLEGAAYEMEVNYFGVIRLNDLFLDMLKSRPDSAIIDTTSLLRYVPSLLEATYSASKAALGFYTQALREHLRIMNSSVKVFELLPPLVATDMTVGRNDKKLSTAALVKALIVGLEKDQYTIRVGDAKALYFMNRFLPAMAFNLVNPKKHNKQLQA